MYKQRHARCRPKQPRDTLHDVEAVVCAYTLGDRLVEVKSYTRSAKLAGEKTGTLDEMRP